jgi:hypothetical protein
VKRCTRCVLPETFPGIQFDEHGICQYCRRMPDADKREAQKAKLRGRFEKLVEQVRPRTGYHALASWSGGKDSTYILLLLKREYDLRVLAFTFDNGFVSPAAFENMRVVSESLGIDHIIVKPSFTTLRQVFTRSAEPDMYPPRALERASAICNSCMNFAKGMALRMALEQGIPMLVYGWSPGQVPLASTVFRTNQRMLRTMVQTAKTALGKATDSDVSGYFPEDRHFEQTTEYPYNISPLAFVDYTEQIAVDEIRTLGWTRPQDTDPNSTNCLLNCYANQSHREQMAYHPYVMELAGLVREGYMSREEALEKLQTPENTEAVATVMARLGVHASSED